MKITVKHIWNISDYVPMKKSILISILDDKGFNINFYNKYIRTLQLDIDDIDICVYPELNVSKYKIFNEVYLHQVLEFIKDLEEIDEIVIHCGAGISRSPAIAIGICYYLNLEKEFQELINNIHYIPNLNILKVFNIPIDELLKERLSKKNKIIPNKIYTL